MTTRLLSSILTLALFCCAFQTVAQQGIYQKIQQNNLNINSAPLYEITKKASDKLLSKEIPKSVLKDKQFYELEQLSFTTLKGNNSTGIRVMLPVENQLTEFHLIKAKLFTPDFVAVANNQNKIEVDEGLHYWGVAKNNSNSLIALSIFNDEVVASIHIENESYTLSKYKNTNYLMMYKNDDLNFQPNFSCNAIGLKNSVISFDPNAEKNIPDDCVRLHIEADYSLYQTNGSSQTNTTNYIYGVFNQVAIMFANESINIAISYLNVWTSPSPYTSGNELSGLDAQNYGRTFGDLVHVVHTNGGGGVAYLDVLCNNSFNTGASGVFSSYSNVPTYSWDVNVITHELGHNFGSPHTHACAWNGNNTAIDGCGDNAGYSEGCTGSNPPGGGTVMSYCHLTNVGVNLGLGFGQQPGDLIRNRVANAACLSVCGPPTCDDGFQNGDETDIDCGGSLCPACPTCDDGILNQDETGVDCGGANCNACPCAGGAGFSLIINPDFYIGETSWDVTDAFGNIVASGGGYANGQGLTVETLCLPPGCYDFTIYDSYGDGLFDGQRTGTYVIIDENGNSMVSGSGNFGSSETTNFCATSTCASIDMNILFDGFPGQSSWDITDNNNNVVAAGGSYGTQAGNSSYSTAAACLPDGCYTLNFYDALGNGMCPFQSNAVGVSTFVTPGTLISPGSIVGTLSLVVSPGLCGSYNLTDVNGTILTSGGASFGSQQSNNFCLSGGLAPRLSSESKAHISKTINSQTFSIQPNPVINQLKIYTNFSVNENTQLQVVNILGEVMLNKTMVENSLNLFRLNVEHLTAGTYFVILKDTKQVSIEKFLKQ